MLAVGAVNEGIIPMILAGLAGTFIGACFVVVFQFKSTYNEYEEAVAQRNEESNISGLNIETLSKVFLSALLSVVAFSVGTVVSILSAYFPVNFKTRMIVLVSVSSLMLLALGLVEAVLFKKSVKMSCVIVLSGWCIIMASVYEATKLIEHIQQG
ncbi:Vacuolar iron transporter [Spatholobus suberectus]|nr:Vacuolar iron transporter [Spatholobus suberectus]